ncbi:MAG: hypothetical protein GX851_00205, partial [Clostridiales bacterium]|nr:hypothetical protein [Clostridiales bacterium]
MSRAKWIWYDNDFEIYHSMLLHCRRQELGCDYPCMWHIPRPEVAAIFTTKMTAETDTVVHVHTKGKGMVELGGKRYPVNEDIAVKKGEYSIAVRVCDIERFPAIFIDSEYLKTDESWFAERCDKKTLPVGFEPQFTQKTNDPSVFPFQYERISPVSEISVNGGKLYDFGREYFGIVTLGSIDENDSITLCYGESEKEARDLKNSIIFETVTADMPRERPSRAFRYIFIKSKLGSTVEF